MPVSGECSAATPVQCGSISRRPARVEALEARDAVGDAAALELVEAVELVLGRWRR